MDRALALAREARGSTSPNPPVGAVLVKDGQIVGEGFTQPAGGRHAEIVALEAAGERAAGAELYVTLEPCSHWGRTPPCADALIAADVGRVHVALLDPNPLVNGAGIARLRDHCIPVDIGEGAEAAADLIEAHATLMRLGRPFVTVALEPPESCLAEIGRDADALLLDGPVPDSWHGAAYHLVIGPPAQATLVRTGRPSIPMGIGGDRLPDLLATFGQSRFSSLLVTGSDVLTRALIESRLVDKLVASKDSGGPAGFRPRPGRHGPAACSVYYPSAPD
jgi:pyrimidine deaminase RibD-like protein